MVFKAFHSSLAVAAGLLHVTALALSHRKFDPPHCRDCVPKKTQAFRLTLMDSENRNLYCLNCEDWKYCTTRSHVEHDRNPFFGIIHDIFSALVFEMYLH
jgi:hypothetical protein